MVRACSTEKWIVMEGTLRRGFRAFGPLTEREADDLIERLRVESDGTEEPFAMPLLLVADAEESGAD